MTNETFKVSITKDNLIFCAGHFISYAGHQCERLHGHNYRTAVEIEAPLDTTDYYVFDFVALKQQAQAITNALDHHMLIATRNPVIHVDEQPRQVRVSYRDREWVFPREDCVLLPIENTTAELLARYIAQRLQKVLREQFQFTPTILRIEVEENVGQSATYTWQPEPT